MSPTTRLPKLCLLAAVLLGTLSACGGSKASQKEEGVDPSSSPESQPTQTLEQSVVVDDEVAVVEQKPPSERTLRDDLVIVCHAPDKFQGEELSQEDRTMRMTTYISENIYTPEAVQLFNDMSVMSVEERQGFFDEKVLELGIKSCPMSLYINPAAPEESEPEEIVE